MKKQLLAGAAMFLWVLGTGAPASAQRAAGKSFSTGRTTKSVRQTALGRRNAQGPRTSNARTQRVGSRLGKKLFSSRRQKTSALGSRRTLEQQLAHKYSPFVQGATRKWAVSMNGKPHVTMTETVTKTQLVNGELHAEVHTSTGMGPGTSVVQVTRNGDLLVPKTAKLGDAPAKGVAHYGVALPAKLDVGQRWSNSVMQEGHTRFTEYRVSKALRLKGPDGKMRNGYEVSVVDTSRARIDGKVAAETTSKGSYRVLEGVGMVWSQMTTNGSTMTHEMISFSAP